MVLAGDTGAAAVVAGVVVAAAVVEVTRIPRCRG